MAANITIHSKSTPLHASTGSKIMPAHFHHLFDNGSSSGSAVNSPSSSPSSNGSSASATLTVTAATATTASAIVNSGGKIIHTIPASALRAITQDGSKPIYAKRIANGQLSLNNGQGNHIITLSQIKAATAAASASSGNVTNGSTTAITTSSGTNNVLIYNIKQTAATDSSASVNGVKQPTVVLTPNPALLTANQILSSGTLKLLTGTAGSGDSKPIIIYPKLITAANNNNNTNATATCIDSANGSASATIKTFIKNGIKKIKLEHAGTFSSAGKDQQIVTLSAATPLTASLTTNKQQPTILTANPKVIEVTVDPKIAATAPAHFMPKATESNIPKPVTKSNIENCLPSQTQQQQLSSGATNGIIAANGILPSPYSTTSSTKSKYYSLNNISPYLPDEIFDTDDEDEEEDDDLYYDGTVGYSFGAHKTVCNLRTGDDGQSAAALLATSIATIPATTLSNSKEVKQTKNITKLPTTATTNGYQDHASYAAKANVTLQASNHKVTTATSVNIKTESTDAFTLIKTESSDEDHHCVKMEMDGDVTMMRDTSVTVKPAKTLITTASTPIASPAVNTKQLRTTQSVQLKKEAIATVAASTGAKVTKIQPVKIISNGTSVKQVSIAQLKKSVHQSVVTPITAPPKEHESTTTPTSAKSRAMQAKRQQIWSIAMAEVPERYARLLSRRQEMRAARRSLANACVASSTVLKKSATVATTTTTTKRPAEKANLQVPARKMLRASPNRKRQTAAAATGAVVTAQSTTGRRTSPKKASTPAATTGRLIKATGPVAGAGFKGSMFSTIIAPLNNSTQGKPITLRLTQEQLNNLIASNITSGVGAAGKMMGKNIATILTTAAGANGATTPTVVATTGASKPTRNRRTSQQTHPAQLVL